MTFAPLLAGRGSACPPGRRDARPRCRQATHQPGCSASRSPALLAGASELLAGACTLLGSEVQLRVKQVGLSAQSRQKDKRALINPLKINYEGDKHYRVMQGVCRARKNGGPRSGETLGSM